MKQEKKQTNAQMQRRLERATLHLDRTKDTKSVYFSDKGLRLIEDSNEGYCVIETGYHRHVFNSFTQGGLSRPYSYTKRVIEIALSLEDKISTPNGYSFQRLINVLKEDESARSQYLIVFYFDMWVTAIFSNLYDISETEAGSFIVYLDYVTHLSKHMVVLSEKTEDMTNKQFLQKFVDNIKNLTEEIQEIVIFPKKTDEEIIQEEAEAISQSEQEQIIEEQNNAE